MCLALQLHALLLSCLACHQPCNLTGYLFDLTGICIVLVPDCFAIVWDLLAVVQFGYSFSHTLKGTFSGDR